MIWNFFFFSFQDVDFDSRKGYGKWEENNWIFPLIITWNFQLEFFRESLMFSSWSEPSACSQACCERKNTCCDVTEVGVARSVKQGKFEFKALFCFVSVSVHFLDLHNNLFSNSSKSCVTSRKHRIHCRLLHGDRAKGYYAKDQCFFIKAAVGNF